MYTLEASGMYVYGNFESKAEAIDVANRLNDKQILIDRNDIKNKVSYCFEVESVDDAKKLPYFDFSYFLD